MVILIWRHGKLKSLPILFIRGHCGSIIWLPDQSAELNVGQSVFVAKLPNLIYAECTTPTV